MPIYFPGQTIVSGRQDTGTVLSSAPNPYDPDAAPYIEAVELAGTWPSGGKTAWNEFVIGCKADGTWSKLQWCAPFIGGNASSHALNALDPSGNTITWFGTVTHNANGIKGSGSGYGSVPISSDDIGQTGGMTCYVREYDTSVTGYKRFAGSGVDPNYWMIDTAFGIRRGFFWGSAFAGALASSSQDVGCYSGTRIAQNDIRFYLNGSQIAADSNNLAVSTSSINIAVLALNLNGSIESYTDAGLAMLVLHAGLNTSDTPLLCNRIQTLQTALGRAV